MEPFITVLIAGNRPQCDEAARRAFSFLSLKPYEHQIVPARTPEALKDAFLEASGTHVVFTAARSGTPIKELDKLVAALENGCDIASGTRFHSSPGCDVQWKKGEYLAAYLASFAGWLAGARSSDPLHGFKAFRREAVRPLVAAASRLDHDILRRGFKAGLKLCDVPVMFRSTSPGV